MSNGLSSHHSVTIERIPITPAMKLTLTAYIAKQKQKRKEEEEQDAVLHRERKIREIKRQQDNATLEQTNEQITQLEGRLEELKKEKHDLFARLKKVLNFEEEQRRKVQQLQFQHAREASEVLAKVGPISTRLLMAPASTQSALVATKPSNTPVVPIVTPIIAPPPVKRPRSPSPHTPLQPPAVLVASAGPVSTVRHVLPPPPPVPSFTTSSHAPSFTAPSPATPTSTSPSRQQTPSVAQRLPHQQPPRLAAAAAAATPAAPASTVAPSTTQQQPTRLIDFRPFSPPHHFEARCMASQAAHLPPRIAQHMPPMIPVLPPNARQMSGVASGFPPHRPPLHLAHHALRMHHMARQSLFQRKPSYLYHQRM